MLNAKDEMFKYLKAVDRQRQLDIERTFKKIKPEVDTGETGLTGGDLLLYRIRKILSGVDRLVGGVK